MILIAITFEFNSSQVPYDCIRLARTSWQGREHFFLRFLKTGIVAIGMARGQFNNLVQIFYVLSQIQ